MVINLYPYGPRSVPLWLYPYGSCTLMTGIRLTDSDVHMNFFLSLRDD